MMNANYYRIRNTIIRGLSKEEIDITDKELKKYKKIIDSLTPQQMGLFHLLVEQGAARKTNEHMDRFAEIVDNTIIGYLSQTDLSWEEVLRENAKIGELLMEDCEIENKFFNENKGDIEKMSSSMKKTMEQAEERALQIIQDGKNQKKAIEELKEEFPELSSALISTVYKKVKSEGIEKEVAETPKADPEATITCEKAMIPEKKPLKLDVVSVQIIANGENGTYNINSEGVKLELPTNQLNFKNITDIDRFADEITEAFRMVVAHEEAK